tara:strand:- start:117 stop:503 length:387 start_codon:yes stop_codon:yes gene_type:complete
MSNLNIVIPGPDHTEEIRYGNAFIIDYDISRIHAECLIRTNKYNKRTFEIAKIVYKDINVDNWYASGLGPQHLIGRIDLSLTLIDINHPKIAWKYPEHHIHPGNQAALADVMIKLFVNKEQSQNNRNA